MDEQLNGRLRDSIDLLGQALARTKPWDAATIATEQMNTFTYLMGLLLLLHTHRLKSWASRPTRCWTNIASSWSNDDRPRRSPARADAPRISLADFHALLTEQHPFSLLLGIEMTQIGYGTARAVLPARDSHQRLGGIVAGPMLMGLADLAMYAAVVGATGQAHAVTASFTINFLRKSPAGAIVADARLLKVGRLSAGEVILTSEHSDEPLAHIVSTWSVPKP